MIPETALCTHRGVCVSRSFRPTHEEDLLVVVSFEQRAAYVYDAKSIIDTKSFRRFAIDKPEVSFRPI